LRWNIVISDKTGAFKLVPISPCPVGDENIIHPGRNIIIKKITTF
jgi:hypothetical protein